MSWDPGQYRRFADERSEPLRDLLSRIPAGPRSDVLDLGCGTGVAIPLIRARWPEARITGVDNSAPMLAEARPLADSRISFIRADIAGWRPDQPADLVFSSAALHWLDDHVRLFPRLIDWLRPGGALAVQMPNNWAEPSHRLLAEVAREPAWRARLAPVLREAPVAGAGFYETLLGPLTKTCMVWETCYEHRLAGDDAVFHWLKGSSLKPLLEALEEGQREAFAGRYRAALAGAYPRAKDGSTTFRLRRLFIVATAPD